MFPCRQQDGGSWRLHAVPLFSAAGPLTKPRRPRTTNGERGRIPHSLFHQLRLLNGFHSHLRTNTKRKNLRRRNPHFKFRRLKADSCQSRYSRSALTHIILYHSCPILGAPAHKMLTQGAYFPVCGSFTSVVCATSALLISSNNRDVIHRYILLGLGTQDEPVEFQERLL